MTNPLLGPWAFRHWLSFLTQAGLAMDLTDTSNELTSSQEHECQLRRQSPPSEPSHCMQIRSCIWRFTAGRAPQPYAKDLALVAKEVRGGEPQSKEELSLRRENNLPALIASVPSLLSAAVFTHLRNQQSRCWMPVLQSSLMFLVARVAATEGTAEAPPRSPVVPEHDLCNEWSQKRYCSKACFSAGICSVLYEL